MKTSAEPNDLDCLQRAIGGARETLDTVLTKARFRERFAQESLNQRRR